MNIFSKTGIAIRNSYSELVHKVTWPTKKEVTNSAEVVMIASIIIALFIFVIDTFFEWGLGWLYKFLQ